VHSIITEILKRQASGKSLALRERIDKIKKPELVAFFFTLIPFLSSFSAYLFAETKVSIKRYIIAVVLGNIPSAALYMFLGSHISDSNYTYVIVIGSIAVLAIAIALIFRKKLTEKIFETSS